MNQPDQIALLLEVQRLARKYGRAALLGAADSLESEELRADLVKVLRAAASLSPAQPGGRLGRARAIGIKREALDDPQRSVAAWSTLIAGSGRPEHELSSSEYPVKARVTFDRTGKLVGSSSEVPKHWNGPIPVELEILGKGSEPERRTVEMDAQRFLRLVARRATLRDFPNAKDIFD
jgi:hypothetical protein